MINEVALLKIYREVKTKANWRAAEECHAVKWIIKWQMYRYTLNNACGKKILILSTRKSEEILHTVLWKPKSSNQERAKMWKESNGKEHNSVLHLCKNHVGPTESCVLFASSPIKNCINNNKNKNFKKIIKGWKRAINIITDVKLRGV